MFDSVNLHRIFSLSLYSMSILNIYIYVMVRIKDFNNKIIQIQTERWTGTNGKLIFILCAWLVGWLVVLYKK
ncbi:hypothetical protein J3Q64DRAFT_1712205 [Phycomyces blakesleeanus]|uniref:Uncharacterized protein n=1 Tax=Phycomyces blakesleeanus TaxID=4837 RepID=A0ABR3BEM5_PHYBL